MMEIYLKTINDFNISTFPPPPQCNKIVGVCKNKKKRCRVLRLALSNSIAGYIKIKDLSSPKKKKKKIHRRFASLKRGKKFS